MGRAAAITGSQPKFWYRYLRQGHKDVCHLAFRHLFLYPNFLNIESIAAQEVIDVPS
jgi:hypothetical protein